MRLIVVGSKSSGNGFLLEAENGEQLIIEAGRPLKEASICGMKRSHACGVLISHEHGDHCKYAKEFIRAGIEVYSCKSVADKIPGVNILKADKTYKIGSFSVTPFKVEHDCENYGYLIYHPECRSIFFATDCYNLHQVIKGCSTYLMECNYEDSLLQRAIDNGYTNPSQADRIRLSHMSLAHAIDFLQQCEAEKSARQIVLIHGSSRHLNPELAVNKFQQVLGIPTYYASKGMNVNLIKKLKLWQCTM